MNWLNAEAEFASWWTGKSRYCYKFEDARAVMGALQSRKVIVQGRPSDFLVIDNGVTFFAEVKSNSESTSFPFSCIQKAQWNAARQTVAANGLYFFFIRKEPEGIWMKVPASMFINAEAKSVKWEILLKDFRYVAIH